MKRRWNEVQEKIFYTLFDAVTEEINNINNNNKKFKYSFMYQILENNKEEIQEKIKRKEVMQLLHILFQKMEEKFNNINNKYRDKYMIDTITHFFVIFKNWTLNHKFKEEVEKSEAGVNIGFFLFKSFSSTLN